MCGIVGIYLKNSAPEAGDLTALGLFAQQHRGQESCGIAWCDGSHLQVRKGMGLVKEVFTPEVLTGMRSHCAIGHVRYPTQGGCTLENAQPHLVETLGGPLYALASNGDLVNYPRLRTEMGRLGIYLSTTNDGEAIVKLLVYLLEHEKANTISAIRSLYSQLEGAYSTVFLTPEQLIAFRDPYGIRPMNVGELPDGWAVSSETCAMDVLRATHIREVEPGEILIFSPSGMKSFRTDARFFRSEHHPGTAHCVFELIYFARPDSFQFGQYVYEIRQQLGAALAGYDDFVPDCVVPVPDSANFIAQGYAKASGAPFELGLIRNHYVGRTFIKPEQTFRDESVKQKFNPLTGFFRDKRIVLVDDSIVRGTTLRKIVSMIRGAGAREIHLRIGSPPVRHPCFYGIDTPTYEELIANQYSVAEIRERLQVDSLKYLALEDLKRIVTDRGDHCYCCFDGKYPVGKPEAGQKKETSC
ncbi:MAG: amidophosphoribosyltransferase [Acidobacteria bacterium]|nr:amidophosphoribosyltransferase [Acidobacteriota bacterium]